jgi:hypothetical protein
LSGFLTPRIGNLNQAFSAFPKHTMVIAGVAGEHVLLVLETFSRCLKTGITRCPGRTCLAPVPGL